MRCYLCRMRCYPGLFRVYEYIKGVYGFFRVLLGYTVSMPKGMKQTGNTIQKTPQKFQSKKTSDGDARRTHVCDESGYRV